MSVVLWYGKCLYVLFNCPDSQLERNIFVNGRWPVILEEMSAQKIVGFIKIYEAEI
jgi:hypothetical protein